MSTHNLDRQFQQLSFMEIDHEIFSTVILSLSLIQQGQLLVSGERICTSIGKSLREAVQEKLWSC